VLIIVRASSHDKEAAQRLPARGWQPNVVMVLSRESCPHRVAGVAQRSCCHPVVLREAPQRPASQQFVFGRAVKDSGQRQGIERFTIEGAAPT